ncbi:MAG: hypothetical protein AB1725_02655 [Armatimonadota bacterium]
MGRLLRLERPLGYLTYAGVLAVCAFLFATFYPPTYEAEAMLVFPRGASANEVTQRLNLGELLKPREGALVFGGLLFLPTLGTDAFSVQSVVRSRESLRLVARELMPGGFDDRDLKRINDAIDCEVLETGALAVRLRWKGRGRTERALRLLLDRALEESKRLSSEFAGRSEQFLREQTERYRGDVYALATRLADSVVEGGDAGLAASGGKDAIVALLQAQQALRTLEQETAGAQAGLEAAIRGVVAAAEVGGEAFSEAAAALEARVTDTRRRLHAAAALVAEGAPEHEALRAQFEATRKAYEEELDRIARAAQDRSLAATLDLAVLAASLESQLRAAEEQVRRMRDRALESARLAVDQAVLLQELRMAERALGIVQTQWMLTRLAVEKDYQPFQALDAAYAPSVPYFPKRGVFTAAGAAAGLLLALLVRLSQSASARVFQEGEEAI